MAANDYVKLWIEDYKLLLEPYSMEERGRIIWAMMDYKGNHIEPEFVGNERFVWPSIKQRLDAEMAAYDRKVEINQANGRKGGRPKKPRETQENRLGFEESTTEENSEKSTGPPDDTPEAYWVWAGCDSAVTPYMASEFRDLRESGFEDALIVAALKEAVRHQAKQPWVYARRILDQAAAKGTKTLKEWEKTHLPSKGNRVDRETPSGNDFLSLDRCMDRLKRRTLAKQAEEGPLV